MNTNVYQMVTDRIINLMQQGIIPWRKPWHYGAIDDGQEMAISYTSRRAYSLLNQWLLGEPGEYLTFNQIKERKGRVKKGAKARMVVFFKQQSYKETDPATGEEKIKTFPLLKWYNVFHLKDTEGIASKIPAAAFRNSVAYIQNWMQALKNDPKMIVWAASRAEKAARYIIGGPEAIKPQQAA